MRGEVLHYDEQQGFGFIAGADGNRYTFRREDLRQAFPLTRGAAVEFSESGVHARDVFSAAAEAPQSAAVAKEAPVTLVAAPLVSTAAPPRQFGRSANGNAEVAVVRAASTGLWSYFWESITTNYANFRGRASRKEYWGFVLFYLLALVLLSLAGLAIDFAGGNMWPGDEFPIATIGISALAVLAGIVPGIAISVRRLHDIGFSGWFYLVMFAVGLILAGSVMILAIVLGLIPSQKRENKWGPVPDGIEVPQQHAG